jgi:hypothetical protein
VIWRRCYDAAPDPFLTSRDLKPQAKRPSHKRRAGCLRLTRPPNTIFITAPIEKTMIKTALSFLVLILAFATSSCVVEVPESSTTPSSAGVSARPDNSSPPELRTKPNGDIEIVFQGGCLCLFDQYGNLKEGGRSCDDLDLHRARQAVKAHLAEQGADFNDV